MGLRDLAKNLAEAAINKIAGDIAVDVTFRHVVIGTYNPVTDTYDRTETEFTVKGVLTRAKRDEDDFTPVVDDTMKLLIPQKSFTVPPDDSDEVLISGHKYEIVQLKTDPAEALWVFSIRRS
jgi:hypothetical protein